VTDFYELHQFQRSELLTETLRRLAEVDATRFAELASEDLTPEEVWDDICRARHIEPCHMPHLLLQRFGTNATLPKGWRPYFWVPIGEVAEP
jgi:hypothetical protein